MIRFPIAIAALAATLGLAPMVSAQSISSSPSPEGGGPESVWTVEHVEIPSEIALGTMAIRVWAVVSTGEGGEIPAAATLALPGPDGERTLPMQPVDGAFDEPVEELVATIDTYTWLRDAAHEYEIRVRGAGTVPVALTRGTIRVKPRIAAADLLLFHEHGEAQAWIGSGAGGFSPSSTIAAGTGAGSPHLVDVNRDGRPDLIVPSEDGDVLILRNRGAGRFELETTLHLGPGVIESAVGDVDGDGRPDLVSVSGDLGLDVRLGMSDLPTFSGPLDRIPEAVGVADLDGDGIDEIWVGLLDMRETRIQGWFRATPAGAKTPSWAPRGLLEADGEPRDRILAIQRFPGDPEAGRPQDHLLVLSGTEIEGRLESWGWAADTQADWEPALTGALRLSGEPLAVLTGRFGPDGGIGWRVAVRDSPSGDLLLVSEKGLRETGIATASAGVVAVCDLDGDGDDDLLTGGKGLRLWMNVRGIWREAGESPYRLESPLTAILPGRLDERSP